MILTSFLSGLKNRLQFGLDFWFSSPDVSRHAPLEVHRFGPLSSSVCLFAHYDAQGGVSEATVYYLRALNTLKFSILFITTSEVLTPSALAALAPLCSLVIRRPNVGLDFGSWRTALWLEPKIFDAEEIILCNDSVYGPFFPLQTYVQQMRNKNQAISGFTESEEIAPHLQSYFLFIPRSVVASKFFREFWRKFRFLKIKQNIIHRYEVGFSRLAQAEGIPTTGLFSRLDSQKLQTESAGQWYETQVKTMRGVNPTLYFWKELIVSYRFPFLKKELMLKNPVQAPNLHEVAQVLGDISSSYPVALIKR